MKMCKINIGIVMELCTPVISTELVRALLSVVRVKGWSIRQAYYKDEFVNAYLDIESEIVLRLET